MMGEGLQSSAPSVALFPPRLFSSVSQGSCCVRDAAHCTLLRISPSTSRPHSPPHHCTRLTRQYAKVTEFSVWTDILLVCQAGWLRYRHGWPSYQVLVKQLKVQVGLHPLQSRITVAQWQYAKFPNKASREAFICHYYDICKMIEESEEIDPVDDQVAASGFTRAASTSTSGDGGQVQFSSRRRRNSNSQGPGFNTVRRKSQEFSEGMFFSRTSSANSNDRPRQMW
mmetsp:Transcript_32022/g.77449  ORF Transcript_32022/g.77449 Transcript_32022/m.77449 type:complete len:226 (-) Transcript_32022:17-694(-)